MGRPHAVVSSLGAAYKCRMTLNAPKETPDAGPAAMPGGSPDPAEQTGTRNATGQLHAKWGKPLIAAGWVALPSIILERQEALGLDALDINIILHIAKHWFEAGSLPHPSKGSIAKAMQVTARTVQKRIARLEQEGFIRRIEWRGPKGTRGSQTSEFDFTGLVDRATPHAIEAVQQREKIRQMKLARLSRKRARVDEGAGGQGS